MSASFVFYSLTEALRQGYGIYDHIDVGYLVRRRGPHGFELAIVDLKTKKAI